MVTSLPVTVYWSFDRTTPSYVSFADNERLIGDAAKSQVNSNPTNTVFDAKRLIGRKMNEEIIKC